MRTRRWLLAALALYVVIAGLLLVRGALAVRAGERHLEAARAELRLADFETNKTTSLRRTAADMRSAERSLGNPVLFPLRYVPIAGRQLRAVHGLAKSAHTVTNVGVDALDRGRVIAANLHSDGPSRVRAARAVHDLARSSRVRLDGVDPGPGAHLFGPIARAHDKFVTEITEVRDLVTAAETGGAGLERFLTGPSRYLVFGANNAEMRAGSGMFLSAGVLEVSDGTLQMGPMRSIYALPPAPKTVPLDADFRRLWGPQSDPDYRFANMTPRFATTAELVRQIWLGSGQPDVDGVLALDPVAIAGLLKVTGPQPVAGQSVTADNALRLFLHDQYVSFNADAGIAGERREFLGDVVGRIFAALNHGDASPTAVAKEIGASAGGRHFLAWSRDGAQQRGWSALGMDGALPENAVLFALQNRGANKLDYFQHVAGKVKVDVGDGGSIVTVDLSIQNDVPLGEPVYIAGPAPGLYNPEPNLYVGIVAINVPGKATNVKLTGGDYDLVAGRDGASQVVSQWVEISRGETLRLRLRFQLPEDQRQLLLLPSARFPQVDWSSGVLHWTDITSKTLGW